MSAPFSGASLAASASSFPSPPPAGSVDGSHAILANILQLEEIDTNMYRGVSPAFPRFARIFGGQTIAQSLAAAGRTVDPSYRVHSLHAYFLRPGNDDLPVIYNVDVLRDGKGFATRRVIARQKGKAIFVMSSSFQRREVGLVHQFQIPKVPAADTLRTMLQEAESVKENSRIHQRMKEQMLKQATVPFPIDIRRVLPESFANLVEKHAPRQQMWMRVAGRLNNDVLLHQCALAYMSDWSLMDTAMLPHAVRWYDTQRRAKFQQIASIDHCMWFHSDFRADSWLLYDMESPRAINARGLSFGRFYDEKGVLVVSTAQEGLLRIDEEHLRGIFEDEAKRETGPVERISRMQGEDEGRWYEIVKDPQLLENKSKSKAKDNGKPTYGEEAAEFRMVSKL